MPAGSGDLERGFYCMLLAFDLAKIEESKP
jgi:hypothetical protein